ncbi:MAG: hypothetical protein U9N46_03885 [Euryarchaeota archaeon]|nr:MAG: hypothetical protein C5S47_01550 [ANME-2 cluster archaeon]MEA1864325.1 hypothetical protein [Euryarchaeota archaeon]
MNNVNYPSVSTTLAIGSIELPNRIVFPAWQVKYANTDGTISDKLTDFYTAIADSGPSGSGRGTGMPDHTQNPAGRAVVRTAEDWI